MNATVYMCEVGVLAKPDEQLSDKYYNVWDKAHGYFDETQEFYLDKNKAIDFADKYVSDGVDFTYAIITYDIVNLTDDQKEIIETENLFDEPTGYDFCNTFHLVKSVYKDAEGKLHENFVKGSYV